MSQYEAEEMNAQNVARASMGGGNRNKEGSTVAYEIDLQARPTRDRPARHQINIDENEDTVHSAGDLKKILAKGQKLKERISDTLIEPDAAWNSLHGGNEVPKKYYPPFMQKADAVDSPRQNLDRFYENEIDVHADGWLGDLLAQNSGIGAGIRGNQPAVSLEEAKE